MAIRAVIFDIGGVLVRTLDWGGRRKWEVALGMPDRALSTLVFDNEYAVRAALGQGPDRLIWEHVADQLKLGPEQMAQLQQDFWSGDRLNTELLAFVRWLRAGWKTGILSNAWPEMQVFNQRLGFDADFDAIVYSFQVGALKPDPRAYQAVLQQLGIAAEEAVFVDDFAKNLAGARALGMLTVHFQDTPQAIGELKSILGIEEVA